MAAPRGELAGAIRSAALLEGDFLLRSGRRSSYYLDKYRFSTRPDLLRILGDAIAAAVHEFEPDATRLAAPELGAVPLAAAASLAADLPFVIVRSAVKDHGTGNRIEGMFEAGERVCLVEDVVTAGGAALEAVEVLRAAGLDVSTVVCVVDREEGGADALARAAVRLRPLLFASEVRESPATPHG
jgi:orotate phosphoribosyltransferase